MNRKTNFIAENGFESPPPRPDYGSVPSKGKADNEQVASMIDNLRREHFILGKHAPTTMTSATTIGTGVNANGQWTEKQGLWAKKETNYELGIDRLGKQTDY